MHFSWVLVSGSLLCGTIKLIYLMMINVDLYCPVSAMNNLHQVRYTLFLCSYTKCKINKSVVYNEFVTT